MKIWKFLNQHLFYSNGGNFINQILWTAVSFIHIAGFGFRSCVFLLRAFLTSIQPKYHVLIDFLSIVKKICLHIKNDNSWGHEDKIKPFLICVTASGVWEYFGFIFSADNVTGSIKRRHNNKKRTYLLSMSIYYANFAFLFLKI